MRASKAWLCLLAGSFALANPYPDPGQVPVDPPYMFSSVTGVTLTPKQIFADGFDVLRVTVDWEAAGDRFKLGRAVVEHSGTEALQRRAPHADPLGSYQATISDFEGHTLAHDALGTGQEFRKLTRQLSFRFPLPDSTVLFRLLAENPTTGKQEEVLRELVDPHGSPRLDPRLDELEVQTLQAATASPALRVNIYADGFSTGARDRFWQAARKTVDALRNNAFPELGSFEIRGVFAPSSTSLGAARDLGQPIPEYGTFLGLFFPYWHAFGRWNNVVYPTREEKYRAGIGRVPYDYPIVIIDSGDYWGVGNFNELTVIPSNNSSFSYLLVHEFGHYFGLNEEYEGGGPTELAFASGISEPWSQNITFLPGGVLKWRALVANSTPIPTSDSYWDGDGPLGAYQGGYADSEPQGHSHKPGFGCVMSNGRRFCKICQAALVNKIHFDLGQANLSSGEPPRRP